MPNEEIISPDQQEQGQAAVAEKGTPERPAEVEGDGSKPEGDNGTGRGKGPDPYFAQKRVTERLKKDMDELRDQNSQILQHLESLRNPAASNGAPASQANQAQDDFDWTNPKKTFEALLDARFNKYEVDREKRDAQEYVLYQEYINPDADMEYIQQLSKSHGLDILADIKPMLAAETLLKIVKADRGIGHKPPVPKSQARTIASNAAQPDMVDGKKVWSERAVKKMTPDEWEKSREDVLAAYKEGRYKKD